MLHVDFPWAILTRLALRIAQRHHGAQNVLKEEFPELASIQFHTADDHFKAVGQCIAAAALPIVGAAGEPAAEQ